MCRRADSTNVMLIRTLLLSVAAATLLSLPGPVLSQTTTATPVYQPPLRGTTAGGRIGGGTRGTGEQSITMSVLAPEHPGLTVSAQPRLYWYVSENVDIPAELTVVDKHSADPLLELSVAAPIQRGIHALDLEQQGIRLEPGVRYEWYVALVVDPQQRSNDIVAGGEIEFVSPAADLEGNLASAGEGSGPVIYAEAGIWYDAIDAVSLLIAQNPTDAARREQRAALLDQVGLGQAAAYDRPGKPRTDGPG
jgi:hypothetical protein